MENRRHWTFGLTAVALAVLALTLLLVLPQFVRAGNLDVGPDGDYASIKAAINAASPGDTIRVQAGTYGELIVITKSVSLLGGFNSTFDARTPRSSKLDGGIPLQQLNGGPTTDAVDVIVVKIGYQRVVDATQSAQAASPDAGTQGSFAGSGIQVVVDGFEITGGTASNGAGLAIDVSDGSKVVVNDNYIHDNAASGRGGGLWADVQDASELHITNNDVTTNTADYGGGLYATVENSGTLVIDDNNVNYNEVDQDYGGMYAEVSHSTRFSIDNNTVMGNMVLPGGSNYGGLYVQVEWHNNGTIDGNTVVGNTAQRDYGGGYVYFYFNNSSTFNDNEFKDNKALSGSYGGLYLEVSHNSTVIGKELVLEGNEVSGSHGGGYAQAYYNSTLRLPSSDIKDNQASSIYGGLYVDSSYNSSVDLSSADVISNSASGQNGLSANVYYASQMDLSNSTFERNTSSGGEGGGLYVDSVYYQSWLDVSSSSFSTNTVGVGGGAYVESVYYSSTLLLDNTAWVSNTATSGNGGGLYLGSMGQSSKVSMKPGVFERNIAAQDGGAYYFGSGDSDVEFTHIGGGLANNRAGSNGGAVHISSLYNGGQAWFSGLAAPNNRAGGTGGTFYLGSLSSGSGVEISDTNMTGSKAGGEGGAVHIDNVNEGSYLKLVNNKMNNSRAGGSGGGVYLGSTGSGDSIEMIRNQLNDNVSEGEGGGMFISYLGEAATLTMDRNELLRNTASGRYGGCGLDSAGSGTRVIMTNNLINGNTAWGDTGGCGFNNFPSGAKLVVLDNEFKNNSAGSNYGGLAFESFYDGARIDMAGNAVIGNRAGMTDTVPTSTGGKAGGVHFYLSGGAQANVSNNDIQQNAAYMAQVKPPLAAALAVDAAPDSPGPIAGDVGGVEAYLWGDSLIALSGNDIVSNTAKQHFGGLYVSITSEDRVELDGNVISANTAITEGGGVHLLASGGHYLLRGNKIVNNSADSQAGLWIEHQSPDVWGVSENNVIADNQGSGLYLYSADFWSTNDTIANNAEYGIMMDGTGGQYTAWLSNTIVWDHTGSFTTTNTSWYTMEATYSDIEGGWPGTGNIDQDPEFVDASSGDYHLMSSSPAVNKVDPTTAPATDHGGIPRPVPDPGLADMGAYEWFQAGVTVESDQAKAEKPKQEAIYSLTVTNDGNLADTFDLDAPVNSLGWPVAISPKSLALNPGASANVEVKVKVPAGTDAGTQNDVTVRATSQSDGSIQDIAALETTAALASKVALAPDRTAGGLPGGMVVYEHTLANLGNGPDTFGLAASSSEGWTAWVVPASSSLDKGVTETVTVYVLVPEGETPGTVDLTTATATSDSDGSVSDSAVDTTTAQKRPVQSRVLLPVVLKNK